MSRSAWIALAVLSTTAIACAAPTEEAPAADEPAVDEAALSACGRARYDAALARYKNAVAWSKDRLAKGVCESEHGYQWGIADEASAAVMTCGDFRNVIKTSPWAAPLRQVLDSSLTLDSLTGDLKVIKDSKWQNWSGVDARFPGLTFWARGEGAYGSRVIVTFAAGGKATWGELRMNDVTGDVKWVDTAATYTIAKPNGEAGKRTITVKHGTKTDTFVLSVEDAWEYSGAPNFRLDPATKTTPALYSLRSECDA